MTPHPPPPIPHPPSSLQSWKVAQALSREAAARTPGAQRSLLLCVVSRAAMFAQPHAEIEELTERAFSSNAVIKLDPFDDERRTKYLFEVLRKRYGYEGTLAALPQQLVAYVSDMAGGVPKHIEEVLKVLHKARALETVEVGGFCAALRVAPRSVLQRGQSRHLGEAIADVGLLY